MVRIMKPRRVSISGLKSGYRDPLKIANDVYVLEAFAFKVKPVFNDHPWDSKIVAIVDRWSLFKGHFKNKYSNWDFKMLVAGRCRQMVAIQRWLLTQV